MPQPWEKYAQDSGPWAKYGTPTATADTPAPAANPGLFKSFFSDIAGIFHPSAQNPYPGMGQEEKSAAAAESTQRDVDRKKAGYSSEYRAVAPLAESIGVNVSGTEESAKKGDVGGVIGHIAAPVAVMGVAEGLSRVGQLRAAGTKAAFETVGPKEIPVGGEKVPVLKGEAEPQSLGGRVQAELKRSGAGEQQFKNFATKQQAAVKQVIRNVAKQTSGEIGPMADEPGEAMHSAADTTFAKARPMYNALDESLATVPDSLADVSKVTEQAISRAKKLGVDVTQGAGESVVIDGRKFTPEADPAAWKTFQEQGMVPKTSGQPISTYMKVRSELLKMQRATPDAALRNHIGGEISEMNAHMETALKGTPLFEDWTEANRLWSKGYAIRDVADAIQKSTKGTPASEQAAGMSKVPTKLRGSELVRRLNDLKKNGILQRAFTPEEIANLRQSADILDRASGNAGREFGFGYSPHSTIWRNLVKLPGYPLVKAMTTTEGVEALQRGNAERFMKLAAPAAVGNRKDALELLRATP